jgi:hypothetical protein
MSDVTGPIRSLPGTSYRVPEGMMCDDHPDRVATHRIQGETDSFGCEMIDMCDECYKEYKIGVAQYRECEATCDWCGQVTRDLTPFRDFEEGSSGRVYQVCKLCRVRHMSYINENYDD